MTLWKKIAIALGALVVLVWFLNRVKTVPKAAPAGANQGKDPIVTVTIDDPNFEYAPEFDKSKEADWSNFQG